MGDIYRRSEEEVKYQAEAIQRAKDKVAANEEERRQAAKAAAAKKKGKGAKKDQKDDEEEKKEVLAQAPPAKQLDLFLPHEFAEALKEKIPRPFIFGPVEFTDLHLSEDEYPFPH